MPALLDVARYRVLFADCDPMRIMYYGSYFRLLEIGRAELFRRLGHPFRDYVARGRYLGVIETTCRYRRPARYDDELVIRSAITHFGRARVEIAYEVVDTGGALVVEATTTHAVVDDDGRPQRITAEFKAALMTAQDAALEEERP
ncbi:MAG: acyl-CoA thioesterase [Deltaproteobacteria bacterium]|nr:acyl-CoA thioesterase [Deltaproteobacteria bacterium]